MLGPSLRMRKKLEYPPGLGPSIYRSPPPPPQKKINKYHTILLVGDEPMSLELRHRCCIEIVTNKSKIMLNRMYTKLESLSPEYDEDCINCAQPERWSSHGWMLIRLSNLLNLPIKSVYPAVDSTTSCGF